MRGLEGRVALVDVLAMEAVRVFLPDAFAIVAQHQDFLTSAHESSGSGTEKEVRWEELVKSFVDAADNQTDVAKSLVRRIFPLASRFVDRGWRSADESTLWLRERRVAHRDVLTFYLERVAGHRLQSFWVAERVFHHLSDQQALKDDFLALDPSEWEGAISALETYEDEYPLDGVVPSIIVLLNILPSIPERQRSLLDFFDRGLIVSRVVLRMLRRLPNPESIEEAVRRILPEIETLSGRLVLLNIVGHEENLGHRLVDPEASSELESALRGQVRAATPNDLSSEMRLFRLLAWTKKTAEVTEPQLKLTTDAPFACALLESATTEELSQGMGTRAVRREKRLIWEPLCDLAGGEETIQKMVEACRQSKAGPSLAEVLDLTERYLSGWRPERF